MSDRLLSENAVVEALMDEIAEVEGYRESALAMAMEPGDFADGQFAGSDHALGLMKRFVVAIRALPSALSPPEGP